MAIEKPSWFKMDPAKFLSDAQVDVMTTLELGACFRLMCRQWIDGSIPDDNRLLARLCRLGADEMGQAWVTLAPFFPTIESGKRANRFMWLEREKVIADLERKSDEGTRAARKRWDETKKINSTPIAPPNGSPMPEAIQEQNRVEQNRVEQTREEKKSSSEQNACSDLGDVSISKRTTSTPSREACKLAALLKTEILRNKPDYRITPVQSRNWESTADRMLRLDRRTPEQVAKLIRWVQKDEFWMTNVHSMDTLRKKFDQLEMKRDSSNGNDRNSGKSVVVTGSALDNHRELLESSAS